MGHFSKKKYLKLAKGFYGQNNTNTRAMIPRVHKSLQYAYIGRKQRRRNLRKEWIQRIGAAVAEHNTRYNLFIQGLNRSNIKLDRKVLAGLAICEPYSFKAVVDEVKVQGKIQDIQRPNRINMLEAYARKLIVDAPLKEEHKNPQLRKEAEERFLPYFFGERADLQKTIKEGLEKQAQIAKQVEEIQK